ncbi:hypothetical protein RF11_07296 [Thelohanellus kitauei]|uniref:Uncharacterized protein n=1 Tax=Thelohanellus kitauei TaxID=669202 RepID=A0A0C2IWI4_THEKT|nr:hypothetical protein RF11_07296 [Thelohanellus kitauei]
MSMNSTGSGNEESEVESVQANKANKADVHENIDIFCLDLFIGGVNLVGCCVFFWVDLIPQFGYSVNLNYFGKIVKTSSMCSVGQNGCGCYHIAYGVTYIIFQSLADFCFSLLIILGEESALLTIIFNSVTPFVLLFWILFKDVPPPIHWNPKFEPIHIICLVSTLIIFPSAILYNYFGKELGIKWVKTNYKLFNWPLYRLKIV